MLNMSSHNGHLGELTHVGLVLREPPRARGGRHCFVCLKRGRFLRLHLGLSQRVWPLSGRRFVYESPVCHRMSEVIGIGAPPLPASAEISPQQGPPCWGMGSALYRISPFRVALASLYV